MEKEKTCCFTGHRNIYWGSHGIVLRKLSAIVEYLSADGYTHFCTGGAQGFDTLAAMAVIHARLTNPFIKLVLILPHRNQTAGWDEDAVELYQEIMDRADEVIYVSEHYFRGCMQKRNRMLVDQSSFCVSYCKNKTGGTVYTIEYARKQNIPVFNIAKAKEQTA